MNTLHNNQKSDAVTMFLCGVCNNKNKIAVTVDEISVCYDCLRFIENRAKQNGIDKTEQLEIDTLLLRLVYNVKCMISGDLDH